MVDNTTAESGRDWIKITALALIPTMAAALVALTLGGRVFEVSAGTVPSSTTTTASAQSPSGSDADEVEVHLPAEDLGQAGASADQPKQPDTPPTPAHMELPEEVEVSGPEATIDVINGGELPLETFLVDVNSNPIQVGDVPTEIEGGSSATIALEVDTTDLAVGPYEMTVTVSTNDGVGDVKVRGTKLAVLVPPLPILDFPDHYFVPHQANLLLVNVTNHENHDVTVGLSSDDGRLDFPTRVDLAPGDNEIAVSIQALALHWSVIDLLEVTVSYGGIEMGTVAVTKYGS